MGLASISTFLSNIDKHKGFSKSERFMVDFYLPPAFLDSSSFNNQIRDLSFQTVSAEIPGSAFATGDYRIYGPPKKYINLRLFNQITFTIVCSNEFYEKSLFDEWMEFINPQNTGWNFKYKDDYVTNINISQFGQTSLEVPIYQARLVRAFPIEVVPMQLNWSIDNIHKLNVVFAYDYYRPLVLSNIRNTPFSSMPSPFNSFLA